MIVGRIDSLGHVILAPGQGVNSFNKNLYSPLLRSLEKPVTIDEARAVASMQNVAGTGHLIRIFRKDMDVKLLAGLSKLTGNMEQFTGQITAEYMLSKDGLFLHKVTHNGILLPGQIRLYEGKCA